MSLNTKRFRSRNGEQVRLALLSGHVAIVDNEWQDLHERFHEAAYSKGCVSEDMLMNTALKEGVNTEVVAHIQKTASLKDKVKVALEKAIEENNIRAFYKGKPTNKYLKESVDEPVPNHIKDEVWSMMQEKGVEAPSKDELSNDIT